MSKFYYLMGWGILFTSIGGGIAIIPLSIDESLKYVSYWIFAGIFLIACLAGWAENLLIKSMSVSANQYRFWIFFFLFSVLAGGAYQCLLILVTK